VAVTTKAGADVAQALQAALSGVEGLRVSWYVADTARPPIAIIAQPTIDYTDQSAGFCAASWDFPITIIVSRNGDREAQLALSRLVSEIAQALQEDATPGVFIAPISARPLAVNLAGQDVPAYELRALVRA